MRIQFYVPHPDDLELFCGGTFLQHYHHQDNMQVLMMTRGGAGTLNWRLKGTRLEKIRTGEATQRFALVPMAGLLWLDFQDGNVRLAPPAVHAVLSRITAYQPNMIYLPESRLGRSRYWHPDHLHTGKIVEEAARQAVRPLTLRYYHSKTADRFVNIDPYFEANQAALRCYASQYGINALPPFHMHALEMLRKRRVKELAQKIGCKYAEGFRELELPGSKAPA